jgi:hypothetical protein
VFYYAKLERLARDKRSILLGLFVSFEENEHTATNAVAYYAEEQSTCVKRFIVHSSLKLRGGLVHSKIQEFINKTFFSFPRLGNEPRSILLLLFIFLHSTIES